MEAKRRAVAALVPQSSEERKDAQNLTPEAASGDSKRVGKELGKVEKTG